MLSFKDRYNESKARSDLVKLLKKNKSGYSISKIIEKLDKYSQGTVMFAIHDVQESGIAYGNVRMGVTKLEDGGTRTEYGIKLKPKYFSKIKSGRVIVV